MNNWLNDSIDLSEVKMGTKQKVRFQYVGEKQHIDFIPSCTCLDLKFQNNVLIVSWEIKKRKASYESFKFVNVLYEDGSEEELEIKYVAI